MSPILLDFPMPITTKMLVIQPMQSGDGAQLFAQIEQSRDSLKTWLPWVDSVKCEADSESTARTFYADFILRKAFHFVICLDGQIIGGLSLSFINWTIRRMNIGYWCSVNYQGKGYATEALNGLVDFAFVHLKAQKLLIVCDSENTKSIKVAERSGFALETEALGVLDYPDNGELRLGRRYAKYV
jgi:RimJ/RimL family protein N-acetyltransferase